MDRRTPQREEGAMPETNITIDREQHDGLMS